MQSNNPQQIPTARQSKVKLIIATGLGNFLETFDFTVYSYFATIIGLVILHSDDPVFSTYISTILFGLGFIARPLGSLILGAYADRHGRKAALFITIMLMGLGGALIAFTPPYTVFGLGAPLLVLLGRLCQGFSAGGELGSAAALLMESAAWERRGIFVAWQFMMQGLSAAAGALCAYILYSCLSPAAMQLWGWRVPFILALLIIPVGLYIRAHLDETYSDCKRAKPSGKRALHPMRIIWAEHRRLFILAVLMVMPVTLLVYIMVIYMPTYLGLIHIESGASFLAQNSGRFILTVGTGLLMTLAAFCGGFICDRLYRRKPFALICLSIAFIAAFTVYAAVGTHFVIFLAALSAAIFALGMLMTVQALLVLEAFPRPVRASGVAVSLALGACLFGGTAQAIVTKIMMATGETPLAPFYYLGPMLLLAFVVYAAFQEERHP